MVQEVGKLLTIFVPIYGHSPFLASCLESLRGIQDEVEVVILEDFPTVHSNSILVQEFGFQHIKHSKNLGLVGNFNFARSHAQTPFLMVIGPDDELSGNLTGINQTLKDLDGSRSILHLKIKVIDAAGNEMYSGKELFKDLISTTAGNTSKSQLRSLMIGYWPYSPGIIWPRSGSNLEYREDYHLVADFCLLAEHLLEGFKIKKFDSQMSLRYRRHVNSVSGSPGAWSKTRQEEIRLYKSLRKPMLDRKFLSAYVFSYFQISSRILTLQHFISSRMRWKSN